MKKLIETCPTAISLAVVLGFTLCGIWLTNGCATTKTPVVTPRSTNAAGIVTGPTTNQVVSVNQAVFSGECLAISTAVGLGLPIVVQYDPSIKPDLHIAYVSLSGILNGASPNSASQIIAALGKSATNAATSAAISNLTTVLSAWEQSELKKYGTNAYVTVITGEAQAAVTAWPPADQ
jgi:hypothetical protein